MEFYLKTNIDALKNNLKYAQGILEKYQYYGYLHGYQEAFRMYMVQPDKFKEALSTAVDSCNVQLETSQGGLSYYYKSKKIVLESIWNDSYGGLS